MRFSSAFAVLFLCAAAGGSQRPVSSPLPAVPGNSFAREVPIAVNVTLYGTTLYGSKYGDGIIFKIAP